LFTIALEAETHNYGKQRDISDTYLRSLANHNTSPYIHTKQHTLKANRNN